MKAIIEEFTENLKKELTFFFDALPSLEEMEAFTMTRLRKLALDLMAGYAEEVDRALYEDRARRALTRRRCRFIISTFRIC